MSSDRDNPARSSTSSIPHPPAALPGRSALRVHGSLAGYGLLVSAIFAVTADIGCVGGQEARVMATAYNSLADQTDDEPDIAAWGDRLEPGMRAIAISRDLARLGLERGTSVCIEGLPGEWRVLDRMHRRWKRRIDIYMGEDVDAALDWGRRPVTIRWEE